MFTVYVSGVQFGRYETAEKSVKEIFAQWQGNDHKVFIICHNQTVHSVIMRDEKDATLCLNGGAAQRFRIQDGVVTNLR